ncbi:MAG: DUF2442 domain-containing protein [Nitrosopumilaceae archaeon]
MHTIINAIPNNDFTILLTFNNSESKLFDMKPMLQLRINEWVHQKLFDELNDIDAFKQIKLNHGTIEWNNGVDLCPNFLYEHCMKNEAISEE